MDYYGLLWTQENELSCKAREMPMLNLHIYQLLMDSQTDGLTDGQTLVFVSFATETTCFNLKVYLLINKSYLTFCYSENTMFVSSISNETHPTNSWI